MRTKMHYASFESRDRKCSIHFSRNNVVQRIINQILKKRNGNKENPRVS